MIASIVVNGVFKIGVNSSKRVEIHGHQLSAEKDIPFIRYRIKQYGNEEVTYIKQMMDKFSSSTHLVEVDVTENIVNELGLLNMNFNNVAKFIYADITDIEVYNKTLSEEVVERIRSAVGFSVDRVMLRDKSNTLDMVAAKAIMDKLAKEVGIKAADIGICSSPLSFGSLACLDAIKAREIMAKYSDIADVALPSANHQCMNCCGCIKYVVVTENIQAPADTKIVGVKQKKESNNSNEAVAIKKKVNSSKKVILQPSMYSL